MTNFQRNLNTGEVEVQGSVIYHTTEYRERRNHYAFFSANHPLAEFDTDHEAFLGLYYGLDQPQIVVAGQASNSIASGWSPIARIVSRLCWRQARRSAITLYLECYWGRQVRKHLKISFNFIT